MDEVTQNVKSFQKERKIPEKAEPRALTRKNFSPYGEKRKKGGDFNHLHAWSFVQREVVPNLHLGRKPTSECSCAKRARSRLPAGPRARGVEARGKFQRTQVRAARAGGRCWGGGRFHV